MREWGYGLDNPTCRVRFHTQAISLGQLSTLRVLTGRKTQVKHVMFQIMR